MNLTIRQTFPIDKQYIALKGRKLSINPRHNRQEKRKTRRAGKERWYYDVFDFIADCLWFGLDIPVFIFRALWAVLKFIGHIFKAFGSIFEGIFDIFDAFS